MAFGTTAYAALEERRDGFLQLKPIEQNGTCTLPYLDQTVCAHILSLDKNMVFFVMSDLLNQKELDALWGPHRRSTEPSFKEHRPYDR